MFHCSCWVSAAFIPPRAFSPSYYSVNRLHTSQTCIGKIRRKQTGNKGRYMIRIRAVHLRGGCIGTLNLRVHTEWQRPLSAVHFIMMEKLAQDHRLNMELDLQSLFGLLWTAVFIGWETLPLPPSPRIWAHIRGRYWSAKIDDISL